MLDVNKSILADNVTRLKLIEELKRIKTESGFKDYQLAKNIGVSPATLHRLFKGEILKNSIAEKCLIFINKPLEEINIPDKSICDYCNKDEKWMKYVSKLNKNYKKTIKIMKDDYLALERKYMELKANYDFMNYKSSLQDEK